MNLFEVTETPAVHQYLLQAALKTVISGDNIDFVKKKYIKKYYGKRAFMNRDYICVKGVDGTSRQVGYIYSIHKLAN